MVKLVLFDIDGTLLLTRGAGMRAMLRAGKQVFGDGFKCELDSSGKLDTQIYAELCALNPALDMHDKHDVFHDAYLPHLRKELHGQNDCLLPGVRPLITQLQTHQNLTLGILTGNYSKAAQLKLTQAQLELALFLVMACGDEAVTREALVGVALAKYQACTGERLVGEQVMIVGDTPRDVACAKAHACRSVAVATGRWSFDALVKTNADVVLQDLTNPSPLLQLLAS